MEMETAVTSTARTSLPPIARPFSNISRATDRPRARRVIASSSYRARADPARPAASPAQARDFVPRAFASGDLRVSRLGAARGFRVAASGAALLPRGLQRPLGDSARGLLGLELILEPGQLLLSELPLGGRRLALFGTPPFNHHNLLFGALQRGVPGLQGPGEFGRPLIELSAGAVGLRVQRARRAQIFLEIDERGVLGLQGKRAFERALLEAANLGVTFPQTRTRLGKQPFGDLRTRGHRRELFLQVRGDQPMLLGGVEMSGLEFPVSRRLLRQRRLELLDALGEVVAPALQVAQLPIEFRPVGHELLDPCLQRAVLLAQKNILVLQAGALLFDLLEAFLLGGEVGPDRGQLPAHRLQAPLVVLELPLGALEFRPPLGERGARLRSGRLRRGERLLEILDALRPFLVPDGERVAFVCEGRMAAAQALVRIDQGLELPLRFEVRDFRALDLLQGLIDGGQRVVELGTDHFDVAERVLDGVKVSAQAFVAPADRVESARDLQRLRRRLAARARTARGESAEALDSGRGFG